jgi:hypothetical protein
LRPVRADDFNREQIASRWAEATMTTIDLIAQEHVKYLASAQTRRDRTRYLAAVARLRALREGPQPTRRLYPDRSDR